MCVAPAVASCIADLLDVLPNIINSAVASCIAELLDVLSNILWSFKPNSLSILILHFLSPKYYTMEFIETFITLPIIIILLYYMIKYLINKLHEYNLIKRYSGPKAYPLIGNLHIFLGDIKDITKKLLKAIEYSPSPWRLWLGPKLFVLLDDPKHIEIICKHSNAFEKSLVYDFMKPCIGNGLVTAPASIWKTHRKLLNPIFKEKSLSIKVDKIIKHSNRFAKILENSNEKEIDISHYINLCTLDMIYDTVLDRDFNFQNNLEGGLRDHISVLIDIATQRIFKFWLHPNIIFYNLSVGKRFREALSHLDKITSEIIKEQKESMQEKKINDEMKEKDATKYTPSFLDALFKSFYEGKEYTEQDIRDEINTIVMAGGDSTAGTISFVFLMLATYPKIQEQVYDELYQIYGLTDPEDEHITYEDIKNMKFLDRVMKETFRLFPPSPFIARNVCEDIEVSEGVIVPKNSTCVLMLYALHRNEKYWEDPLQFNPDRFLPGNYNTKHFLPFSIVPRVCIGLNFAMLEIKGIIATVLRKFSVHVDVPQKVEDIALQFGITMKPAKKIFLRFRKR